MANDATQVFEIKVKVVVVKQGTKMGKRVCHSVVEFMARA